MTKPINYFEVQVDYNRKSRTYEATITEAKKFIFEVTGMGERQYTPDNHDFMFWTKSEAIAFAKREIEVRISNAKIKKEARQRVA